MRRSTIRLAPLLMGLCLSTAAHVDFVLFDSGAPNGAMAMASRPGLGGKAEIEAADDFLATGGGFRVSGATFTGLISGGATLSNLGQVVVEIYRVFPKDSADPPSGNVSTRVNSPSDVAFAGRDLAAGTLTFTTTVLNDNFSANNSVLNGINKSPNQTTGGEGTVRGVEVQFNVSFSTPFNLPADHYFFVPQVQVTGGEFYWLSGQRPLGPPFGFAPDLQAWIRNDALDPDWLRVGTDIVGAPRRRPSTGRSR